ncbi:MAG: SDR family NAD(P)-dependent oxidoreductase [Rhodospirillales bacterium]|nr:SDR family NAD(P)-dependent oxidoreductase [Rhodospirillales bacterium]
MTTPQFSFDEINEKVAVINGGSGVLCGDFARALAGIGAKIALLDINKNAAQKAAGDVVKLSGAQVIGIACDVLSKESLEAARIQINSEFGPIDILVNGAGGNAKSATTEIEQISDMVDAPKSFYGLEIDGFNSVFNLNFIGTLLPTQILSQDMSHKKSGVIINISSMAAFHPLSKIPAYSAAKAAVSNITEWLAVHLAPMGIRVNAMASGFFLTQQLKFLAFDEAGNLTPRYKRVIGKTAIKRLGDHEEF